MVRVSEIYITGLCFLIEDFEAGIFIFTGRRHRNWVGARAEAKFWIGACAEAIH